MVSIESRVTSLVLRSKISPFVFLKTLSSPGASEHEDGLASELYYPSGWAATRAHRLRARTVPALRTLRPLAGFDRLRNMRATERILRGDGQRKES